MHAYHRVPEHRVVWSRSEGDTHDGVAEHLRCHSYYRILCKESKKNQGMPLFYFEKCLEIYYSSQFRHPKQELMTKKC